MNDLTREIRFQAAYDRRSTDPKKNYGIHGVTMTWYVKGPEGAVQFQVFTNWQVPKVRAEQEERERAGNPWPLCCVAPMPSDLGYHSHTPRYEGQSPMSDTCEITGGTCYYDGSTLNAEPIFDILTLEGEEACWKAIENYYRSTFNETQP
jgi:hypothetical protein